MILASTDGIPGRRIVRVLGLVRGSTIRARHIGRDVVAVFRNIAGGEIQEYTKLLAESREQSIDRMIEEAERLGANAVVAVRFSTSSIMGAAAEVMCYGTAVVVDQEGAG
jgi:uncharacterized protein YbjQ (UPF0145 family)